MGFKIEEGKGMEFRNLGKVVSTFPRWPGLHGDRRPTGNQCYPEMEAYELTINF
jgi:hypothetical protein